MGFLSSFKAAKNVLTRYGLKVFVRQTLLKLKKHNFEKADLFLERKQVMPVPSFLEINKEVKELVTVVIPCYNHESFIADALYSIHEQTYKKIEIIIVDDCSSDNSVKIIKKLLKAWGKEDRFCNLTFIEHKENKGAHYSINEAVNQGAGEYFAVLNSDDMYENNRFSVLINLMKNEDIGLAFSKVKEIDEDGKIKHKTPFSVLQRNIDNNHIFLGLCSDNLAISSGNLFFKRKVINKIGLFRDFKYIHDWDFLMRSALITKIGYSDETTYYYRMHSANSYLELSSMTKLCDDEMVEMRSRVFKRVYKRYESDFYSKDDYPKIVDLLYRRIINNSSKT
jgi:glycosyltransferase involved in cell wall biosynthesis